MSLLAVFGITNDGLNLAVNLLLLFLVVLWLALIYWTYADARRRIDDSMLVGCATLAALFPYIGTIVYMVVRPPEYLEDVHERELEIAAAEARLAAVAHETCPYCDFEVERSFLRCPSCLRRLREPCTTCSKPLDPRWRICPYCETEVGDAPAQPRRRERKRERSPGGEPRAQGGERTADAPARSEGRGEPQRSRQRPRSADARPPASKRSAEDAPPRADVDPPTQTQRSTRKQSSPESRPAAPDGDERAGRPRTPRTRP